MNLTHVLSERRLQEKLKMQKPNGNNGADGQSRHRRRHRLAHHGRRKTQEVGDYYYLYGGDVAVRYVGPVAIAVWDYYYHYLITPKGYESIYVWDYGDGQKSFPVCYFPADNVRSSEDFSGGIVSVEEAKANLGCIEGEVFFTITEDLETRFSLFTPSESGVPSEVPMTAGGQITPIVYTDISIGTSLFTEIVGGFNETVVDWTFDNSLNVIAVPDSWNFESYGAEYGIIEMVAADLDGPDPVYDEKLFEYFFPEDSSVTKVGGRARGPCGLREVI